MGEFVPIEIGERGEAVEHKQPHAERLFLCWGTLTAEYSGIAYNQLLKHTPSPTLGHASSWQPYWMHSRRQGRRSHLGSDKFWSFMPPLDNYWMRTGWNLKHSQMRMIWCYFCSSDMDITCFLGGFCSRPPRTRSTTLAWLWTKPWHWSLCSRSWCLSGYFWIITRFWLLSSGKFLYSNIWHLFLAGKMVATLDLFQKQAKCALQ